MPRRALATAAIAAMLIATAPAAAAAGPDAPADAPAVAVGDMAPDFTLRAASDGAEHTLSAHRGERPVLLVFFRGAW